MALSVKTEKTGSHVNVAILGEVDVSCAPELTEALEGVMGDGVATIDVDMAQVPYIDSTGIGVLVAAAHRAQDTGAELTVSNPQPNVLRVLTLLGVGSEFNVNEA
ncbi:STAS domain-containing protein [Atopobiaceae bacterium 24-176]